MAVDERMRRRIHARFEELLGDEMADALMELFPPVGWAEIATRADLDRLGAGLRGETAELRGELRAQMAELRGEMAELRGETAELRGELRGLLPRLYAANLLSMVGLAGLVLAAARLA